MDGLFPLRQQHVRQQPGSLSSARLALRVAGLAALAAAGVALGRGVVGLASSREHVESASASATQLDAPAPVAAAAPAASASTSAPPVFTSSIRSWVAPPIVPTAEAAPTVSPPPADAQATATPVTGSPEETYTVAAGDTLSQIANRYAIPISLLARANNLTDANRLIPGARLLIPSGVVIAPSTGAAAAQPALESVQTPAITSATDAATSPDAAVRSFYAFVEQGQFERAAGLWSQHMRNTYPPAENINSRFAATRSITVSQADVVELDAVNGRASVAVQLTEVVGSTASTSRRYAGYWYLVRGPAGWLLDQPSLQPN